MWFKTNPLKLNFGERNVLAMGGIESLAAMLRPSSRFDGLRVSGKAQGTGCSGRAIWIALHRLGYAP